MKDYSDLYKKAKVSMAKKACRNRRFFDHLVILVWVECNTDCRNPEWMDTMLYSYHGIAKGTAARERHAKRESIYMGM